MLQKLILAALTLPPEAGLAQPLSASPRAPTKHASLSLPSPAPADTRETGCGTARASSPEIGHALSSQIPLVR